MTMDTGEDDGPSDHDVAAGEGLTLTCPIRGQLKIRSKSADGLTPSEEALRVDAIIHLLSIGYEKEYILVEPIVRQIGNAGRNSLRADLAVCDRPVAEVKALPVAERVKHCRILVEIKRDNAGAKLARETQVEPLMAFGPPGCLAVYWDDVEQRVFWHDKNKVTQDGYLAALPFNGEKFNGNPKLTYKTLSPITSLLALFDRVENALHARGVPKHDRYDIVLALLLAKLRDERQREYEPDEPLAIQDPVALGMDLKVAKGRFEDLLTDVDAFYGQNLPRPMPTTLNITAEALADALAVLAPRQIGHVSRSALQDFFMKFAKDLYKWDMAQYFTPTPLTEFIVEAANPRAQESVKDPALGSGDFLMAASEREYGGPDAKPMLYGADTSETAAQVASLNKILHNALHCEIRVEDSLANIDNVEGKFSVRMRKIGGVDVEDGLYQLLICNPPFGTRIVLRDPAVLAKFDLGYEWKQQTGTGRWFKTNKILKSQEIGMLFVETCVRQAMRNGGRVAIILPNGYLGNRRGSYAVLREWILRHTYVAAVVSFPRFTFKGSGADVSASVVFMERRAEPLKDSSESEEYPVAIELIEQVGWEAGQKNGGPTYIRDETDGTLILNENNERQVHADFDRALQRLRGSAAGGRFGWLAGATSHNGEEGHTIPVSMVLADELRCLDPKRFSQKHLSVRRDIKSAPNFRLGDVVKVVAEMNSVEIKQRSASKLYRYVEIANVGPGLYSGQQMRGWQLPARAKHLAEPGDLFVGGIWGSVSKWFLVGKDETDLIATNGFHRLQVKDPDLLLDIIAGFCSEAFAVQMRAISRGSDGLAEVTMEDLEDVVLPRVEDKQARAKLLVFVEALVGGVTSVRAIVDQMVAAKELPIPDVPVRPSHVVLV